MIQIYTFEFDQGSLQFGHSVGMEFGEPSNLWCASGMLRSSYRHVFVAHPDIQIHLGRFCHSAQLRDLKKKHRY